jgi:exocyst complex component 6
MSKACIYGPYSLGTTDDPAPQSLDTILSNYVSDGYGGNLTRTSTLSQVAQIITNLEHFEIACAELERSLTALRCALPPSPHRSYYPFKTFLIFVTSSSARRGGTIRLTAATSFSRTQARASTRITSLINSKLDDFFGLSEYDWTPAAREDAPSMYLYELVNWLTTVVDSLQINDSYKDEAYRAATAYIAQSFMVRFFFPLFPRLPSPPPPPPPSSSSSPTFLNSPLTGADT